MTNKPFKNDFKLLILSRRIFANVTSPMREGPLFKIDFPLTSCKKKKHPFPLIVKESPKILRGRKRVTFCILFENMLPPPQCTY